MLSTKSFLSLLVLAVTGAGCAQGQMPVPLMDNAEQAAPASAPVVQAPAPVQVSPGASKGLEALLRCAPGTQITKSAVEAQFQAMGLVRNQNYFVPAENIQPILFGNRIVAAAVDVSDGEKKVSIYMNGESGKQIAKKLKVTKIDREANTDEASYFKKTGKKTTLLVGSAYELSDAEPTMKFQSSIACQVIQ